MNSKDDATSAPLHFRVGRFLHTFRNNSAFPVSSSFVDEGIEAGCTEMLIRVPNGHTDSVRDFIKSLPPCPPNAQDQTAGGILPRNKNNDLPYIQS
jgi:hypothetical protein